MGDDHRLSWGRRKELMNESASSADPLCSVIRIIIPVGLKNFHFFLGEDDFTHNRQRRKIANMNNLGAITIADFGELGRTETIG